MREQEDSPTPVSGWVVVDLFCGIGGLTHGLRLAGFDDTAVTGTTPTNFDTHDDVVEDIASKRRRAREWLLSGLTLTTVADQMLLLDYDTATLVVHDYHRKQAGGVARGAFFVAGDVPKADDAKAVERSLSLGRRTPKLQPEIPHDPPSFRVHPPPAADLLGLGT